MQKIQKTRYRYAVTVAFLFLVLLIFGYLNLRIGSVATAHADLVEAFTSKDRDSTLGQILWNIRLPRLLAAAVLGGALAVSGFLLQTFFENPIAGPFVLGISSGAKLAVALAMVVSLMRGHGLTNLAMILAAFAGSMLSMGFVLLVSFRTKKTSVLIVCGVMIGYICSAITDFVIAFADDSNVVNLHTWSLGSFSGMSWGQVRILSVTVCIALLLAFLLSKPMEAYQMGETYARNVGVRIPLFRLMLILLSSILSATVTAFAGPISFVGVAVPHLVKRLLGTAKPILVIPTCFLGGGAFCLFSDLLARTLFSPTEISISSVTAILGAPVVIWIMLSRKQRRNGLAKRSS